MGIVTSLHRVSDAQLAHFAASPGDVGAFLFDSRGTTPSGYLDKSVDGLQALFRAADVPVRIAPLEMPGEPIQHGAELYFAVSAETVANMARHLRATPFASLTQPDADPDDLAYLHANYERLVRFVDDAATRGLGALLTHG